MRSHQTNIGLPEALLATANYAMACKNRWALYPTDLAETSQNTYSSLRLNPLAGE